MPRPTLLFCFFLIVATYLLSGCANPVTPTGGPKDISPPKIILCTPPVSTIRFAQNNFRIDFNEFITLKNPASEIYVSPPMKTPPDTRLRGKSLIVKFESRLDTNSTYSVTFGNSITDLTEGNILKGFNYVFSTGNYVDSLSLQGTLVSAFDHKPQKAVFVELYVNNNDTIPFDSLPLRVPPYYITKTDENGNFIFNNLQNKKFKLFALSDQNGDLIFNQLAEKIAFYDSLVTPYFIAVKRPDTAQTDSVQVKKPAPVAINAKTAGLLFKADSIHKADSISQLHRQYPSYPLYLFEETDSVQHLVKSTFIKEGIALFVFRFPVKEVHFIPLNFDSVTPWYKAEFSRKRDSVTLWISRSKTDSLVLKVVTGQKMPDTVSMNLEKKELSKKAAKNIVAEQLTMTSPAITYGLNQYKNKLIFTFSYPLVRWDFSKVLLVEEKDTLHPSIQFSDSIHRNIVVTHKWKEDKNYTLLVPDSVFYGITGISQDSIRISFKSKSERDFGNLVLSMNMEKRPGQYIVQLMNDKETALFEEQIVTKSGKIHFDFMQIGRAHV